MEAWGRLRAALDTLPAAQVGTPTGGRIGAALLLLRDPGDGDLELVLTRRRDDLPHHPGQISFPGGRLEPGETVEAAALREAREEIGLDPGSVELLGRLPPFYIPPSRFWLQVVIARWRRPHPLTPAQGEVAEIITPRLSRLRDAATWRGVELSTAAQSWAWQLDDAHLLWGATALVTSTVLEVIDPSWHGGADPSALPPERQVRPWEQRRRVARRHPPLLGHLPEVPAGATLPAPQGPPPSSQGLAAAADAIALVVRACLQRRPGDGGVLVLAGGGGNGRAGIEAARVLSADGVPVQVVTTAAAPVRELDVTRHGGAGDLPAADVVVDALVGAGLDGPLRDPAIALVHGLRHLVAPVVAVDLPSGVHPSAGLVGDCVTADVTLALGAVRPAVLAPGMGPFVGELYLVPLEAVADSVADAEAAAPLVRVVRAEDAEGEATAGWRE